MFSFCRLCLIPMKDHGYKSQERFVRMLNPKINKGQKGSLKKNDEFSHLSPEEKTHLLETAEDFQAIQTLMHKSRESPRMFDEIAKNENQIKYWLNKKIIERKYFKKEPETNLLTYDAKEQIRFLHAEDSKEWTPEALSKSFPISVEGVKKLLKSKCKLRNLEEIAKHDKRVLKHWQSLQSGKTNDVASRYLNYLKNDKTKQIEYDKLGGMNTALPIPKKLTKDIVSEVLNKKLGAQSVPGTFETMAQKHLQMKAMEGENNINKNSNNNNFNKSSNNKNK